jgi:hypothetical protein
MRLRTGISPKIFLTEELTRNWSRWLKVIGGAVVLAGAFCLLEATMAPGYRDWDTGASAAPFSVCLTHDFPGTFLAAAAVLTWISRKRAHES